MGEGGGGSGMNFRASWEETAVWIIMVAIYIFTSCMLLSGCSMCQPDAVTLTAYKGIEQGASLSGPSFSKDVGISVGLTWYLDVEDEE